MADAAHDLAVDVGSTFRTFFECAREVATNHPSAYMATMENYGGQATYFKCYAIEETLEGENRSLAVDDNFISCFIKGILIDHLFVDFADVAA